MPVSADTLRILMNAGLSGEDLLEAVTSIDQDMAFARKPRSAGAERQARYRERHKASQSNVTSDDPLSPKKVSPAPPSKNNPLPGPQPPNGGLPHRGALDLAFDQFRSVYPKRKGSNPGDPAKAKLDRALRSGVSLETILAGARRYADEQRELGHIGTPFVMQMAVWLNQGCWKDYQPDSGGSSGEVLRFQTPQEIIANRIAERAAGN